MKDCLRFTIVLGFAAGLALAMQDAPPAPPAAPAPPAQPAPAPVPRPAVAPLPPRPLYLDQDSVREMNREAAEQAREQAREQAEQVREQAEQVREQSRELADQEREQARQAMEDARINRSFNVPLGPVGNLNLDLNLAQLRAPLALQLRGVRSNDGTLYGRGENALDDHKYDQALDDFNEVVARGGPKADGALYWKAYTLNKLGRRDEALAAIAQLRTGFPSSHWLEDAKALELEIKQAAGKPVSPDSESDDELKLMALNGLSQTDPARAFPAIEKLLKGPASPALKKRAVFVLASNNAAQAQQLLEQIAKGNSNPDLQLTAIRYMVENRQMPNRTQTLFNIYGTTNDAAVKREIIQSLGSNGDGDHLMQIYRSEKDPDLRRSVIDALGNRSGNPELWQLYQSETSPDTRAMILGQMYSNGSVEKLTEAARNDKDPKVRIRAIEVISSYRAANLNDTLGSLYAAEQDPSVKREILNVFSNRRDAKALVDLYHKENNFDMKKAILQHLGNMHTPEANELYMEILSK